MEKSELTLAEYAGYFQTIQTKLTTLKNKFNDSSLNDLAAIVQNLIDSNPFKSFTVGDFPAKLSASSCVILSIKDNELGGNTYFGLPTSEYATLKPKLDRINNTTHYRKIFVIPSSNACNCFYGCFTSETPFAGKDLLFDPSTWASTSKFIKLGSGSSTWTTSSSDFTNYRNNYTYFRLDDSDTYKVCGKQNFANNSSVTSGPISAGFKLNAASGAGAIIPLNRNVGEVSEVTDSSPSNHCLQDELLFSADGNNIIGEIGNFGTGNLILTLTPEIQDINFLKECAERLPDLLNYASGKWASGEQEIWDNENSEEPVLSCGCPDGDSGGVMCSIIPNQGWYNGGQVLKIFYTTDISKCLDFIDVSNDYASTKNLYVYGYKGEQSCPLAEPGKYNIGVETAVSINAFPMHISLGLLKTGAITAGNICTLSLNIIVEALNKLLDLQILLEYIDIADITNYGFEFRVSHTIDVFDSSTSSFSIDASGNLSIVEPYGGDVDSSEAYTESESKTVLGTIETGNCSFYETPSTLSFYLKILK